MEFSKEHRQLNILVLLEYTEDILFQALMRKRIHAHGGNSFHQNSKITPAETLQSYYTHYF